MKILVFLILLLSLQNLKAQKWYWGTGLDGKKKEFMETKHIQFSISQKNWQAELEQLESDLSIAEADFKAEKDGIKKNNLQDNIYKLKNRKALALISLDKTQEALILLNELENNVPGESRFAENLAFCYEKMNDYDQALKWIKAAVDRNKIAGFSNIWVYEKILDARKKTATDPNYLKNGQVVDLGLQGELKPLDMDKIESHQLIWKLGSKAKHIRERIQLHLQRGPSKDPVIASLIGDLATIYAVTDVCEKALPVYKEALTYGHPNEALIKKRIAKIEGLIKANKASMSSTRTVFEGISKSSWFIIFSIASLILLIGYMWWKDRKTTGKVNL